MAGSAPVCCLREIRSIMESPMDWCFAEEGHSQDIVLEKQVFRSKVLESHVQLACSSQYCAFPLNGNELCIWNIGINPVHQPLHLIGHHHSITAVSFGSKMDPLLVCSASRDYVIVWNLDECTKKALQGITPCGIVIGTLLGIVLYVRFSPDDQMVAACAGNRIYILNAKNEAVLAELEGHLAPVTAAEFCTWEKNMLISVSEDRSFKVWDCCTGVLIYQSAVLTAFPLLSLFIDEEKKQIITGCADGQLWIFSLISGHNYRCVVHINVKKEIERFYSKTGKYLQQFGEIQNNFKLSGINDTRVEETVETSLPILRIEHCDKPSHTDKEENFFPAVIARYLWIGSSTGLFIINLANFEIEAALHYKDYSDLSIQFAGSCVLTRKAVDGKVLCLLTSMFESVIALLEISPTALMRAQKNEFLSYGKEKCLLVIASCSLLPNSPLNTESLKKSSSKLTNKKTLGPKGTMKDQPLVFHNKIKSSGYTSAPQMKMFSPNTKMKKTNKVLEWKNNCKRKNKEYPLENFPPTKSEREISAAGKPTSISCIQYSGDGEQLACGLADKSLLVFNSNLTGTPSVFSGHDGAINSVGWSHNKKWLVSASEDKTVRIWSVCNTEPALLLGREMFQRSVRFAQFYYIDKFILLCCGAEFHLVNCYLDISKDDLKRYKQKSVCNLVQKFPMASTVEITSLSAVNDFYSYIVLAAGSNRALEVFDLNAGCSAAVIPDVQSRSVHQICQNKGSAFSTQQPEAYNLFMTSAIGDGIKLWDLRTLRCERRFEGHVNRCHPCGIAVSPCGRFIASGSEDKCAYIYEMHSSTFSHKLTGHTESVINVAFNPSSAQLTTATLDGKLQLFLP
ncbi:WD repeat-containing protein 27 isoform A [Alligator mississippiensis]|uniref:WD repeat-containing protein 27 isoform A n=2 Tax=Alligator mississippiensis TaxID=8496 RepID=A0A151M2P1_ALLMI|nr:WD repeat-containing protein 27 isoform A [Alligator mississippiensis]